MKVRYSVISSFLGRLRDRFTEYQCNRSMQEKIALASGIRGLHGLEVVFPTDFDDCEWLKEILQRHRLEVSAINVNLKGEQRWHNGSLGSADASTRQQAVRVLKEAMDGAAYLGCNMITVAFLNDGYDYPFQRDYAELWNNLVEGLIEVADYQNGVKVSVEYKLNEPAAHIAVGSIGKALCLCTEVARPNVGVTLDVGHALYAGENPAESACLLAEKKKLFYVHLNDNFRNWDWDLIPGSVNFWDYLELFFYLRRYDYQGWMSMDVFPKQMDPVAVFASSISFAMNAETIVKKIDEKKLLELMRRRELPATFSHLQEIALNLEKVGETG